MKAKSFGLILFVILASLSLGGCGCFMQQIKGETPPPQAPGAKVVAPEVKPVIPVETPQPEAAPAIAMKDVNFDFDKYNIRPGDAEILKQNADWFKAIPGKKVRVEGYCDEKGTIEYNLVLGQKRADSAKSYLVNLGVDANLIETVSYGKEKPLDPGHNEAAWAKNRRAQFLPLK
ncbi:MAG: peptidoglycan-associated lipoprotein Pal [Proteobacteria bacterium]|nr:peptidoglycan-associated lipoprotein Pal [Pseudomonadota bacterium]